MAFVAPAPAIESLGAPIIVDVEVEVEPTRPPDPRAETPAARSETPRDDVTPRADRPASIEPRVAPSPVPSTAPTTEPRASGTPVSPPAPTSTSEYDQPAPAVPMG